MEEAASPLEGLRVLVVEDEGLVAFLLEDMFETMGCQVVASAGNIARALEAAEQESFDFALLDVNLNGERVFPVAEALAARRIPLAFSTGYGPSALPAEFAGRPVLTKPFKQDELEQVVIAALGGGDWVNRASG